MAEIMGRMAEQKQIAVQAAERKLCERLNELAAALTAQADAADASRQTHVATLSRCPKHNKQLSVSWPCSMFAGPGSFHSWQARWLSSASKAGA
jgi:hypothetical protein